MLIGQQPGRKYRWGNQTKDDGKENGGVRGHQSDAEGAGNESAMLKKGTSTWQSINKEYGYKLVINKSELLAEHL